MAGITEQFHNYCMHNYNPLPVNMVKGEGSLVWDDIGKEYIDLAGGIAVTALGHGHPLLKKALSNAMDGIWHLSNYFTNRYAVSLAEKLCSHTFADKVFFANSGSEVNEAALKLARKYGRDAGGVDKHKIIACNDAFHGRSLFTVSVGGQEKYSEPFAPLPGGIEHIPFNDCDALEQAIDDNCCAFIVEPVQGEGGVLPATTEFMQRARELCSQHNVLLICDEIQCGVGRTGYLYDYMRHGITPDVVTTAKALGCGIPIGAMLMSSDTASVLTAGTHGSTFGGNPLACAVGNAALEIITKPQLLKGVLDRGQYIRKALTDMNHRLGVFSDIRGQGLLIGCQFKVQYQDMGKEAMRIGLEHGVLLLVAAGGSVLRFAPSLIIEEEHLGSGMERIEQTLQQLKTQAG